MKRLLLTTVAIATIALLAPAPTSATAPPLPSGDVDCSGETNSTDAAIILQYDAALVLEFSCPDEADVNLDGVANSIDAAIVLQHEAGLRPEPEGGLIHHFLINGEEWPSEVFLDFSAPVQLELLVENTSNEPISRFFATSQRFEFEALSGTQTWRWSHGQIFGQFAKEQMWEPGEAFSYQETWDQTDNDGRQFPQGRGGLSGGGVSCSSPRVGICGLTLGTTLNILPPTEGCTDSTEWLIARLSTNRPVFSIGESVPLSFDVTNCTDAPIARTTLSGQLYDFFVLDEQAEIVWFWSFGRAFTQAILDSEYAADSSTSYIEVWPQETLSGKPLEPGTYEIRAELRGTNQAEPLQSTMVDRLFIEILP